MHGMKNNENEAKSGKVLVHLFVSLPTDDVFSLRDISSTILVHQLKSKVELRVGIPGDLIHLFFMNKELLDDKPVREYKLKHGCILRVRLHKTWLGLFLACSKGDSYEVFDNGVRRMDQDLECRNPDVELWNKLVVKRATFALFMATHRGYLSLMLELLNSSAADINGSTIFGRTSLHIAAFQGFVGCVSLLLSEGALSSAVDIFGKTPLQLAYVNRHVYCQKRLYLHQTSGCEELELSRRKIVDESGFPPIKQKDKTRKVIKVSQRPGELQNNKTQSLLAPVSGTPSISVLSEDHSSSPPDTQSHSLPVMKIIEPPKTNQLQDETYLPHDYPNLNASSEVQLKHNNDLQRNIPKAMRGIEGILRTSQDDVIGEYHNIEESMADVNMTTIKLTLPREDINEEITTQGGNCEDQPEVNYDGHEDITETHIGIQSSIQTKRILGLALKAEETKGQEEKQSEQQENELLKSVGFDSETYSSTMSPRRVTSLSYDEWLEKKRESGKLSENERPKSASTVRMKVGREMNIEAFQKWVNDKKKFRRRRGSESSATTERNRSSSGVSFEIWLSQKRQRGESFTGISSRQEQSTEKPDPRPKTANLGGKTFAEWLSEKRKGCQNGDSAGHSENKRNRTHSGKSFREWLKEKRKERQKDIIFRETSEIEKLQEKAFLEEQRRFNPRVKTFDEWLEEKRVQSFIEFVESRNAPERPTLLNCKTKFPEDAELVFDMWLTSKHMEELSKEEERYEEMKEKWKKKDQDRLQIRSGILQKLNQMKKSNT